MILNDNELIFSVRTKEGVKRCVGVPVVIEGFEQFGFIADKRYVEYDDDDPLNGLYELTVFISELSTGYALGWGDDRDEAIEDCKKRLAVKGADALIARIAEIKAEFGTLNDGGAQ